MGLTQIEDNAFRLLAERHLDKEPFNDWAINCLEAGFDSPSLRMLAAMPPGQYSPSEYDEKLTLTMKELGWNFIAPHAYLMFFAREIAQAILSRESDAVTGASEIFGILQQIDAHSELGPWYEIDEMRWDRAYFEESGTKGYYYRDEKHFVAEIDRACSDLLKRTKNHLLPLPATSFDEAEKSFSHFLESFEVSSKIQWIFHEDLLMDGMQVLVHTPLPDDNAALARQCFELGKERNLGIGFHAAYSLNELTCCYVQLPVDELDAQYKLMGDRNLKLSCRNNMAEALEISSYARWLIKGFLSNKLPNRFWLEDIPSRSTLLPVLRG